MAPTGSQIDLYQALARQLRADSIRCSTAAGSGHPTSSLSAADLMAVLLAGHLRHDWSSPTHAANDHLVFSKGHASPLSYALFRAAGAIARFVHLAVREMPGVGKPAELIDAAGISVQHIAGALRELARTPRRERDTANA